VKRSGMTASEPQRDKVRTEGLCRNCYQPASDPAHCIPRANGGCNDPLCVIPLCRPCHNEYDQARTLDVLPLMTRAEQAHAVSHVGLAAAYRRTTNQRLAA
jgi:hypothetical protein